MDSSITKECASLVAELFKSAAELPPQNRQSFLDEQCRSNPELRAEVESLLQTADRAEKFLETPAAHIAAKDFAYASAFSAGHTIGHYEIVSLIGKGGMGEVYLAQDRQLRRRVALKLVRRGMESEHIVRRFKHEQRLLAALNHPNIAQLYEADVTDDGIPFFVMEHVDGKRIDDYCRRNNLSIEQRLELFCKVCAAVHYAHQHLVVHRDIKPSNILVPADGEPKLLDFGIAKLLEGEADALEQTITIAAVMTPEYASPEHVRGDPITTASDVYSLGVLLYELLTGTKPYKIDSRTPTEIARVITEKEPTKPSTAVRESRIEDRESADSRKAPVRLGPIHDSRALRGDLDNIVLMAMRKEPQRRYSSVAQFATDIRRHLDGLPVRARKDTLAYRTSKFVSRHRVGATAAMIVLLSLIAGLIGTTWQARIARQERDRAQAQQAKAERISEFLATAFSYSDPSAAAGGTKNRRDATIAQMLDDIGPRIKAELASEPEVRASVEQTIGNAYVMQARFAEAENYLNSALQTQLQVYGEHHPEIAYTLSGLATAQALKGDYARAEKTFLRAIAIYHQTPPTTDLHTQAFANALVELGNTCWTRGDYTAAESAYTEGMSVALKLQGRDRTTLADAKAGLGLNRYALGRMNEASSLLREAVEEYRKSPDRRWKLPFALNFLGQVLTVTNNFDEALKLLGESESISKELFGEDSFFYSRSLWLQVYAMCFKGACGAAEKVLSKAEEIDRRVQPDNKTTKANLCDARNFVFTRTGRATEGEKFGRESVRLYQESTDRGSNSITLARIHLAESLIMQKQFDEAERVLLEAYSESSGAHGKEHYRTREVARELVKLYEAMDKPEQIDKYRQLR